jgi:hypothetical protein
MFSVCVIVAELSDAPTNSSPLSPPPPPPLFSQGTRTAPCTLILHQDHLLFCHLYLLRGAVIQCCDDCPGSSHGDWNSPTKQRVRGVVQVSLKHRHCNTQDSSVASVTKFCGRVRKAVVKIYRHNVA